MGYLDCDILIISRIVKIKVKIKKVLKANITDTKSIDEDYLYPFAPINFSLQKDGFIKIKEKIKRRNPLLSNNHVRGK